MQYLLERHMASACLDVVKMKPLVPCDVENTHKTYKTRITSVVFDPLNIEEVDERFRSEGYVVPDEAHVIATTEDGSILLWGGLNSVYHLKRGEEIKTVFDKLAFQDLLDLTRRFKIKNKKVEIDEMRAALIEKYTPSK